MEDNQSASELKAAIEEARSLAREQVAAAWQLQLERVREELDNVFDERFADIEARLQETLNGASDQRLKRCRDEVTESLNQTARRLRAAGSREEWIRTLIEAASPYCGKSAVFAITPKGLSIPGHPDVPLTSAPAFASAVESKDTVVAVGTPRELSQTVSSVVGDASAKKIYLFPLVTRQSTVAVLYAEPADQAAAQPVDVSALELLASLAAASIDATEKVVVVKPSAINLVRIAGVTDAKLPKYDQESHLRAQRFARTRVAEMLLHKARQVRAGRGTGNLYGVLKEEIDAGREAFRKEFLDTCPSMVDYFHQELQKTLAKDSADVMGPDYPGPVPSRASAHQSS